MLFSTIVLSVCTGLVLGQDALLPPKTAVAANTVSPADVATADAPIFLRRGAGVDGLGFERDAAAGVGSGGGGPGDAAGAHPPEEAPKLVSEREGFLAAIAEHVGTKTSLRGADKWGVLGLDPSRPKTPTCPDSPPQICRMICPSMDCLAGQCAMRIGMCCGYSCQQV